MFNKYTISLVAWTLLCCIFIVSSCSNGPKTHAKSPNLTKSSNLFDKAVELLGKRKYKEALPLMKEYLDVAPGEEKWVYIYLGDCHRAFWDDTDTTIRDYTKADENYEKALLFEHSKTEAILDLIMSLVASERLSKEQMHARFLQYFQQLEQLLPYSSEIKSHLEAIKRMSPQKLVCRFPQPPFWADIPKVNDQNDQKVHQYYDPRNLIKRGYKNYNLRYWDTAISWYEQAAYGYKMWTMYIAWEPRMGEEEEIYKKWDNLDDSGCPWLTDLSPFAFNKIAECWIEKNKEILNEHKQIDDKTAEGVIENYKKAIYYYGRAICRNEYFIERNMPKIAELRQDIGKLNKQKESEPQSPPE